MHNSEWKHIIEKFRRLGGTAENVELRTGKLGRGIYSINPGEKSILATPKNLLIKRSDVRRDSNNIFIKANSSTDKAAKEFAEYYYNELSWGNGGSADSQSFLSQITSMPTSIKNDLAKYRFIDKGILNYRDNLDTRLERFIDERAFLFRGESVLVPMIELVNHSNYAPPFRVTKEGLETPPTNSDCMELLHKYSGKNSPMSLWRSYGFSSRGIVSFSIPFEIKINQLSITLRCFGQQESGAEENNSINTSSKVLSIDSLPVGCQSPSLPLSKLISIISPMGAKPDLAKSLMIFIQKTNMQIRRKILDALQAQEKDQASELSKALKYEIESIQASLEATKSSQL